MPDLIDRLRAAGVPSGYTADAHPARSILSALAADKRAILLALIEDECERIKAETGHLPEPPYEFEVFDRARRLLAPEDG